VIFAVSVICAGTMKEALELSGQRKSMSGREPITGDPTHVSAALHELANRYDVDEFMIITDIPDYDKRIRSYELVTASMFAPGAIVSN